MNRTSEKLFRDELARLDERYEANGRTMMELRNRLEELDAEQDLLRDVLSTLRRHLPDEPSVADPAVLSLSPSHAHAGGGR